MSEPGRTAADLWRWGKTLLDVGCGEGESSLLLASRLSGIAVLHGHAPTGAHRG